MSRPIMYPMCRPLTPSEIFFAHILATLRRANVRYQRVAHAMRHSIQPTSRACHRAHKLGLGVDIEKAVNCPQRAVSVVPLPLLDTSASYCALTSCLEELGWAGIAVSPSSPIRLRVLSPLELTPLSVHSYHPCIGTHTPLQLLPSRFSVSPASPAASSPAMRLPVLAQLQKCDQCGDLNVCGLPAGPVPCEELYVAPTVEESSGHPDMDRSPAPCSSRSLDSELPSDKLYILRIAF